MDCTAIPQTPTDLFCLSCHGLFYRSFLKQCFSMIPKNHFVEPIHHNGSMWFINISTRLRGCPLWRWHKMTFLFPISSNQRDHLFQSLPLHVPGSFSVHPNNLF